MSETTLSLTEFLLARLAEDERHARKLAETDRRPVLSLATTVNHPERLLAEVAAKRRIVEWAAPILTNWPDAPEGFRYVSDDGLDVLKILALPYADHEDFREEWAL